VGRTNYGFQKRQKEMEKQKKKDEKAAKKQARKDAASDTRSDADGGTGDESAGDTDEESDRTMPGPGAGAGAGAGLAALDPALRVRLDALCDEGWELWSRFDADVRQHSFHPFVAADYPVVLEALIAVRAPGRRFLEWGSATGVITIMADLLGFDAYGIEIDPALVDQARGLARRTGSNATFAAASFLPSGYRWKGGGGINRTGTIADGDSGYLQLGRPLEDFHVVFGYPWTGEEAMMLDLMRVHGRRDGVLLVHTEREVRAFTGGRPTPLDPTPLDPAMTTPASTTPAMTATGPTATAPATRVPLTPPG